MLRYVNTISCISIPPKNHSYHTNQSPKPLPTIKSPSLHFQEVTIRRYPPRGVERQNCGPVDFQVPAEEDNQPRNILEEIVWHKASEIFRWREKVPLAQLMLQAKNAPAARDFIGALRASSEKTGKPGLIAEVKKASPSKGVIQPNFDPVKVSLLYMVFLLLN